MKYLLDVNVLVAWGWSDDRAAANLPEWCDGASRTTDAHLVDLAEAHGARLATLDTGIPGAFLVPRVTG